MSAQIRNRTSSRREATRLTHLPSGLSVGTDRTAFTEMAANPDSYAAWMSQRPSDRIWRTDLPRFRWVGHGKRRRRIPG